MVDMVVSRLELKDTISQLLTILMHMPRHEAEGPQEETVEEMVEEVLTNSKENVAAARQAVDQPSSSGPVSGMAPVPAGSNPAAS